MDSGTTTTSRKRDRFGSGFSFRCFTVSRCLVLGSGFDFGSKSTSDSIYTETRWLGGNGPPRLVLWSWSGTSVELTPQGLTRLIHAHTSGPGRPDRGKHGDKRHARAGGHRLGSDYVVLVSLLRQYSTRKCQSLTEAVPLVPLQAVKRTEPDQQRSCPGRSFYLVDRCAAWLR